MPRDDVTERSPTAISVDEWKNVLVSVKNEFRSDHVTLTSSGVAFFAFLSLVPLLGAAVSIYGLIADASSVSPFVNRLPSGTPTALRDLLEQQLTTIARSNSGALGFGALIGFASGLWTASAGFDKLIEGLNIAYDTNHTRSFLQRRGLALAFAAGAAVMLALVVVVIRFAGSIASGLLGSVSLVIGWLLVAALFAGGLATLYRYGPKRPEPRWRWVTVGSIVAVVGWTLVSMLFAAYVALFGSFNETYGSLGAVVILLLWLYLTAAVVVIGAELNAEAEEAEQRN